MNAGISLVGVGNIGNYQLCALTYSSNVTLFGSFYPTVDVVLLNTDTGDLISASDVTVKYKPGFLLQGKRDAYGDTDVLHCQPKGCLIHSDVVSVLGSSFGVLSGTRNTGFQCINDPNTSKVRIFSIFGTSSTLQTYRKYHYNLDYLYCSDTKASTCSKTIKKTKTFTEITWFYDNVSYSQEITVKVTGNINHYRKTSSDHPDVRDGSYVSRILTKSTNTWTTSSGTSTSNLTLQPWTPPCSLNSIQSQVILADVSSQDQGRINRDLLDLRQLPDLNDEWLTCFQAVESLKYLDFEWIAFLRDTYHWEELVKPLSKFSKKGLLKPNLWAELYLWFIYGIKPQTEDTIKLVDTFGHLSDRSFSELVDDFSRPSTRYATRYHELEQTFRGNTVSSKANTRLRLRSKVQPESMLRSLLLMLESLDIGVTAQGLWELIPYSFIVDWFANTSDFMKWADSQSIPNKYDLEQRLYSKKF